MIKDHAAVLDSLGLPRLSDVDLMVIGPDDELMAVFVAAFDAYMRDNRIVGAKAGLEPYLPTGRAAGRPPYDKPEPSLDWR